MSHFIPGPMTLTNLNARLSVCNVNGAKTLFQSYADYIFVSNFKMTYYGNFGIYIVEMYIGILKNSESKTHFMSQ